MRTRVALRKVKADSDVAQRLALRDLGSKFVCRVNAVLEAEGRPVGLMELVLPLPLFDQLSKGDLEQSADNLYSVYQRVCGVTVLRMEERVLSRTADESTAKALAIPLQHPILVVDRLAYTFDDVPVEIRCRSFEGLQHQYLFAQKRLD